MCMNWYGQSCCSTCRKGWCPIEQFIIAMVGRDCFVPASVLAATTAVDFPVVYWP